MRDSGEASRRPTAASDAALARGFAFLERFQTPGGSVQGPYNGPLFLAPGFVMAQYATGRTIAPSTAAGLVRYATATQNEDGGFPLHVEGESYLFTTTLNYVALRLLGQAAASPALQRARQWILEHGSATHVPAWGKYWLAILRLYEWEGVHPVLPEMLLLPRWLPLHPARMWCHARAVYLPIACLYGSRWQAPDSPLLEALRCEIYERKYAEIDFSRHRDSVAATDLHVRPSPVLRVLNTLSSRFEASLPMRLRRRALAGALRHIRYASDTTSFLELGPVSKTLAAIACHAAEPDAPHTRQTLDRMDAYLFPDDAGLTMQAYNSSEVWDTAFSLQAIAAAGFPDGCHAFVRQAYRFLDDNQVRKDAPDREAYFRSAARGGWPFSNAAHGWPIVDCTAEALIAVLQVETRVDHRIAEDRLFDAVDLLTSWQNRDGGWPTYERCRGGPLLDRLNPSEMFADVMTDSSCVELTSAAIQGLVAAQRRFGAKLGRRRVERIERALRTGVRYVRASQRADGSWPGRWGICFTYGTWFGVWALSATGARGPDPALARAREFLLARQLPDGGWGECYRSCIAGEYVQHPAGAHPVMTAWALLALLVMPRGSAEDAIDRGVRRLLDLQSSDGDWPDRGVTGVFNRTCMLNYRFYRNYFPLWALALRRRQLEPAQDARAAPREAAPCSLHGD